MTQQQIDELIAKLLDRSQGRESWFAMGRDEKSYFISFDWQSEADEWMGDQQKRCAEWVEREGVHLVKQRVFSELEELAKEAADALAMRSAQSCRAPCQSSCASGHKLTDPVKVINAPEWIYLQIGDVGLPAEVDFGELHEVTWCADRQFDTDIAYVRFDALASVPAQQLADALKDPRVVKMSVLMARMISALRRMKEWENLAGDATNYLTEIGVNKTYTLSAHSSHTLPQSSPNDEKGASQ